MRRLKDDNSHGIVEDRLAKNDGVQLRVDLVGREDGEYGDRIGGRERGADRDAVDKGQRQRARQDGKDKENNANDDGREKGAGKRKGQDRANVAEEICLVELVARRENNRRQQQVEKDARVETHQGAHRVLGRHDEDQSDRHAGKDGDGRLVDGRHFFLLQHVAGEEGDDEEHDRDEERPRLEDLVLGRAAS